MLPSSGDENGLWLGVPVALMHPSHTACCGNVMFRWRKGGQEAGGGERERAVVLSRVSCRAGGRMHACSKWKFLPGKCCAAVPVTNATAVLGGSSTVRVCFGQQ